MKIIVLIENTDSTECSFCEHGLSIYIETEKHRLLVDTGQSDSFIQNASDLGIDLKAIDTVILSHGHYDHSGGIMALAEIDPEVRVYMQRTAAGEFYHDERYIGIDKRILSLPNVTLLEGDHTIDEELSIFSGITGRLFWAKSNLELSRHENGNIIQDEFEHEQCLVVTADDRNVLISGCAHNGILNILDKYRSIYNSAPDMVISGFHMMKKTDYTEEEISIIKSTAERLSETDTVYYTGHCTGEKAFAIMKEIMGDKLHALYSGLRIL